MGNLKRNPRLQAQLLAVLLRRLGAVNGRTIKINNDELPSNPYAIITKFNEGNIQISYEDADEASIDATKREARKTVVLSMVRRNDDTRRYVPRDIDGGPSWMIFDQREERHIESEDELLRIDPRAPLIPLTVN